MRLIGSLSFRLTLLYVLVFCLSVTILLSAYYLVNVYTPIEAIKNDISLESDRLAKLYEPSHPAVLAGALEKRARTPGGRTAYHVLLSADGNVLTKNLPSWPTRSRSRWLSIEADTYHSGEDNDHMALAYDRTLPDGARFILGRDIEDLRQREATVFDAARWMIGGGLLFSLFGGILMSRSIGKRIESINRTARRVMTGDLHERIPTYGSGDDFDHLAETLNLMLHRIQKLLESIRRVSDSVAHELRTPLARLHADLSELSLSATPERRPLVEAAVSEAEKLIELFDAVLRIARLESVGETIAMEDIDLSTLLADVVEIFGPSAEEKGITLNAIIPPRLHIGGNANLLFQAVGNLIDNAIKYALESGQVTLEAHESATQISLSILDNGPGIPVDQLQNVLERFVRLPLTADIPGIGLGLSFVKVTADVHNSSLTLENAAPGLRVLWRFPRPIRKTNANMDSAYEC